MEKTIYLIRHSGPFVNLIGYETKSFKEQSKNMILSVEGEIKASILSENSELKEIDKIYSSNYARTIATAKYIANSNNICLNVLDSLNEREFGVEFIQELPDNFIQNQFLDYDYKLKGGESLNETRKRIKETIFNILDETNKKAVVVLNGVALMAYLSYYCNIVFKDDIFKVSFKDSVIYNKKLEAPEVFKIIFDENKKVTIIENINYRA